MVWSSGWEGKQGLLSGSGSSSFLFLENLKDNWVQDSTQAKRTKAHIGCCSKIQLVFIDQQRRTSENVNISFDLVPLYVSSLRGPFEGNKDLVAETGPNGTGPINPLNPTLPFFSNWFNNFAHTCIDHVYELSRNVLNFKTWAAVICLIESIFIF